MGKKEKLQILIFNKTYFILQDTNQDLFHSKHVKKIIPLKLQMKTSISSTPVAEVTNKTSSLAKNSSHIPLKL